MRLQRFTERKPQTCDLRGGNTFIQVLNRVGFLVAAVCILWPRGVGANEPVLEHVASAEAIGEVLSGARQVASAAWWGFDPEDATDAIQQAIDSGARKVVVPYMGAAWVIRPVKLRGDLELVFEPGVLVLAKRGEFRGGGDSLFTAHDVSDVTIRGDGATLRMWKQDYQNPPYERAEWRMGIRIMGCQRVRIEGICVESSGGDGIYIGSSGKNRWCEDVVIKNCVCRDNHRQGISVISAENLLVENSTLVGTAGTPPEAGIDFEPDSPDERLVNCLVRKCLFQDNSGHAILVYLKPLTRQSESVSIRFENCLSRMGTAGMSPEDFEGRETSGWSGMTVGAVRDGGPTGLVEFVDCTSENTGKEGAKVFDKSADGVKVRFVNCKWSNSWISRHREFGGPRAPVFIELRRPSFTERPGGIEFVRCHVYDDVIGPAVRFEDSGDTPHGLFDVTGQITVRNKYGVRAKFGPKTEGVDLQVVGPPK